MGAGFSASATAKARGLGGMAVTCSDRTRMCPNVTKDGQRVRHRTGARAGRDGGHMWQKIFKSETEGMGSCGSFRESATTKAQGLGGIAVTCSQRRTDCHVGSK